MWFLFFFHVVVALPSTPNILIFLADDLGYGDLPFYGHPISKTPNLNQLAKEGMIFSQWYSGASLCTPSRAALLTGRLAIRSGLAGQGWNGNPIMPCDAVYGLPKNETTFADIAKIAGYRTGMVGKWHLGQKPEYLPTAKGFDSYVGIPYSWDMGCPKENLDSDNCSHYLNTRCHGLPLLNQTQIIKQPVALEEISSLYVKAAQDFILTARNNNAPWLLFVAFQQVHQTVLVEEDGQYSSGSFYHTSKRGRFGDALEEMDWMVGKIRKTVRTLPDWENTLTFFLSDNGPAMSVGLQMGSPGLLSGLYAVLNFGYADTGKATSWEAGFRIPAVVSWPKVIPRGSICQEVVTTMDIFPTLLEVMNIADTEYAKHFEALILDGHSLVPFFLNFKARSSHEYIFYWYSNHLFAVRQAHGPYKVHFFTRSGLASNFPRDHCEAPLLFNVEKDPSELYAIPIQSPEYILAMQDLTKGVMEHAKSIPSVIDLIHQTDSSQSLCCQQANFPSCNCDTINVVS